MRKFLARLWPPYGFFLISKQILPCASDNERWGQALNDLSIDLPQESELADAERLASSVLDAETKRKDVLEAKASSFIATPTVATAIAAAIAPLTKDLGLSSSAAMVVTICYTLALVHLLVSSWYAITARRAEPFVVLSSFNAHSLLSQAQRERIVTRLAYARMNEPRLLMKSNRLSVAEDLFLRGLAFLAVSAVLTLTMRATSL